MNKVERIYDYIGHLQIPLVWRFGEVTVTMTRQLPTSLVVATDSTREYCQEAIFSIDDSILDLVAFLAQCTITGTREDGTFISAVDDILENVQYVLRTPVDIDKVASWLIDQYEAGNKLPLISRIQVIMNDVEGTSMILHEENTKVYDYYRTYIDATALENAHVAGTNLRVALAKLSTGVIGKH